MTVALITTNPLAVVASYGVAPSRISVGGVDVHAPAVGWTSDDGAYKLVTVVTVGAPTAFQQLASEVLSLNGNTLTTTRTYTDRTLTKPELIAYAATKRAAKMLGGTTVGSVAVATDPGNLALIALAYTKALATPAFTMVWNNNGTWITLTNAQIQSSAQAVGAFLGGCLADEKQAVDAINASTITAPAQIDAVFA